MCEWGGVRCDDGAGGAGFGHDRTTPWGILTVADTMTGSVAPPNGGEGGKNGSDTAAGGEGADLHRVLCRPTQPGGPAWAGDGSPACRRGGCARLGPASSPWHSELRHAAPRALSRVALLVGGRAGHSPRLVEPQPRRIEATCGQGRCPKVSGGRRAAAGRPPSLRTRPCLARRATGSPLPQRRRKWSARVPHQQVLLQQPTCRVGSRYAARAAATRRDRHQRQPATLLRYGRTQPVTQLAAPRWLRCASRRNRSKTRSPDRDSHVAGWRAQS